MKKFFLKKIIFFTLVFSCAGELAAQTNVSGKPPDDCGCEAGPLPGVLAVVNDARFTGADISPSTANQIRTLQQSVVDARKNELDIIINSKLLSAEAKKRGLTTARLLDEEIIQKVKEPTEADAQAFYDQNRARLQGDFQSLKSNIVAHLRQQRQQDEARNFAQRLRAASDVKLLVEFATPPATTAERSRIFAYVNSEPIRSGDVEDNLRPLIFSVQEEVYRLRQREIDLKINDALLGQEAQKRKITTRELLRAEVDDKTSKVTEARAEAFYNENKNRINGEFAKVKQQIIDYLQEKENEKASAAFASRLRSAASIQVFLKAPEQPVYKIPTEDQPAKGNSSAPVTIVEFIDFQCPRCAESHGLLNRLVDEYQGKVRLVVIDYPLAQHAGAFKAAEAAEAAREQGKFWEYADILLRNQSALEINNLKEYAGRLGLDRRKFDAALDGARFSDKIQRDIQEGNKLGVGGTPTIFINGKMARDNSHESLKAAIEAALKAP